MSTNKAQTKLKSNFSCQHLRRFDYIVMIALRVWSDQIVQFFGFFCYGGSGLTRRPRSVEMSLETGAKNRHHFHVALYTQWAEICKTM